MRPEPRSLVYRFRNTASRPRTAASAPRICATELRSFAHGHDEALKAEQELIKAAVRKAAIAANPALEAQLDRADQIDAEIAAAQTANDAEKVAALTREAETIRADIDRAQAAALEQPEISAQVAAFYEKLHKKIIEINADAKPLIDRRNELAAQILKARAG